MKVTLDLEELVCGTLVAACVLLLAAVLVDACTVSTRSTVPGEVVERAYAPAHTDVGTGVDGNGKAIVTTTHVSEKYTVIVKTADGVRSARATAAQWAEAKPGPAVYVRRPVGGIWLFPEYALGQED